VPVAARQSRRRLFKDNKGTGPIHIACETGYFECVKTLLDRGKVDVNCTDMNRETLAFICCVNGHVEILHLLIQHGADFSLADTSNGKSPAHMASAFGRVKMLALISKVNANLINQRDNQGRTPLLYARQFGQNGAAEWLVEHGAEEAGEVLEGAELERMKVQLIQMHCIIPLTRPFISHISSSLYTAGRIRGGRRKVSIISIGV
jgi:ankyrin repeat protein